MSELHAEEIKNSVEDLLRVTGSFSLRGVKATIDLVTNDMPDWMLEAEIPTFRKRIALKTWLDARDNTQIFSFDASKEFFTETLRKTICDKALEDDVVEEICKGLLIGFNAYKLVIDTGFDYDHLHQVVLGIENGVVILDGTNQITNDTPIDEIIKIRLAKQYALTHPVKEESDEEEVNSDEGSTEE